jgi:SAM-dependent methyltransferase
MPDLDATTELFRLLGDPTRLRLLALLAGDELSVAELTDITQLAQSRVSTHLGLLRDAGLIRSRRAGSSTFHALATMPAEAAKAWEIARSADDPLLAQDRERAAAAVAARAGASWADQVAGQMARHYSPGRTWEAAARGLVGLCQLGRVLDVASGDGALAELLAPRAEAVVCVDLSARVVASGQKRLAHVANLRFVEGDMHALPLSDAAFDAAMLMSALEFAHDPRRVLGEVARVLVPGGRLVGNALRAHGHGAAVAPYDHVQLGFEPADLRAWLDDAGFDVAACTPTAREARAPHFEVVTFHATRR